MPKLKLIATSADLAILEDANSRLISIPTTHLDLVLSRNWSFRREYYTTGFEDVKVSLHEIILGVKTTRDLCIDHINGDTANNLPSNLQLVSQSFNCLKKKKANFLPLGVKPHGNSFESTILFGDSQITFGHQDVEYLANLVYTVYTQSGLATHDQFMAHRPEPYKLIHEAATEKHQMKLEYLIEGLSERVKKFRQVRPLPSELTPQ